MNYILNQTKDLVKKEKHFTVLILQNLKHIEEHKLFAKLGYSSLYKYLIEELKYSEGEANIRVANVKLMKLSVKACEKILSGELSLTNGKDLFRAVDQVKNVSEDKMAEVIGEIKNKSTREAQSAIAQFFDIEAPCEEKIVLRGEVLDKLNRLKKKYKVDSTLEILEILFERDLKEVTVKNKVAVKKNNSRYIPVKVKAATIARAQLQCEYVGASGRRCQEKRHLQFEHMKPFSRGGKNSETNIKYFCRSHNQLTAMEVFGQKIIRSSYDKVS
jgi:uncharacterized protein YktA (UPF0223 family)